MTDWCCSFAQFGAFSAQLRPHAAKKPGAEAHAHLPGTKMDARFDRRAWEFEYEYFQPMREAIQVRPNCDLLRPCCFVAVVVVGLGSGMASSLLLTPRLAA